jgi:poly(3-hydroxybutyrate) depolymerase
MYHSLFENSMLYGLLETGRTNLITLNNLARLGQGFIYHPFNPYSESMLSRYSEAGYKLLERVTNSYPKPEFNITSIKINDKSVKITEESRMAKPFCNLIHFKKPSTYKQPKLLIVAPLAGHHATLLRNTVEEMLPHFDVYITDWIDAKLVPIGCGTFNLDDYIDYIIEFLEYLGPGVDIMAVCQPTVPVLAAISIMSEDKHQCLPRSMILMGGPIDTRKSPTEINFFALERSIEWFENHLITRVPVNYPGFMRRVYPGFLQLAGFIALNPQRHFDEHAKLYENIINGEIEKVEKHIKFYDEYFSVMDLPADFYLQTIKAVFQEHSLPLGKMMWRGRKVNPAAITKTALLGIEGEHDDISGLGQTKAALTICKNIPNSKKDYYMQPGVGHYGVFSGSKFRNFIVPKIVKFTKKLR